MTRTGDQRRVATPPQALQTVHCTDPGVPNPNNCQRPSLPTKQDPTLQTGVGYRPHSGPRHQRSPRFPRNHNRPRAHPPGNTLAIQLGPRNPWHIAPLQSHATLAPRSPGYRPGPIRAPDSAPQIRHSGTHPDGPEAPGCGPPRPLTAPQPGLENYTL